jgi:SOS-response transcriptional repressor LexA
MIERTLSTARSSSSIARGLVGSRRSSPIFSRFARWAWTVEDDYVVVRQQSSAQDGDIIVALVGEEATVKRFFRERDHIRLQPENSAMEPIRSKEVHVLGKVVGLLRRVA